MPSYQASCEKELEQTKYEAMHPKVVIDSLIFSGLLPKQ
jgi:hypothetical protein